MRIIIEDIPEMPIAERGKFLLDLEILLRATLGPDVHILLPPEQDRNAIRRFRGVEVK